MKAGRELDAIIAEKVMEFGYSHYRPDEACDDCNADTVNCQVPMYSTDWGAAGLVVEKLKGQFESVHLDWYAESWACKVDRGLEETLEMVIATADTAPLAICLAALKAIDSSVS